MPEFLAETYAPRGVPSTAAPHADDLALAAEQVSQPGAAVRFLGAVVVPDEETCFCLYQAPSASAVREAMTRARLRPERITQAVTIRPPPARPGPHRPVNEGSDVRNPRGPSGDGRGAAPGPEVSAR